MKRSITLVNVVLDQVEKIFLWSLANCAMGSAFFCQVWRSIKQPDGGLAVTGDDDFHECSEALSLSVASWQFLTPDTGKIVLRGGPTRIHSLAALVGLHQHCQIARERKPSTSPGEGRSSAFASAPSVPRYAAISGTELPLGPGRVMLDCATQ
jgi:hypothetical protein